MVLHFSDLPDQQYTVTVPNCLALEPLLHTDWMCYHGTVEKNTELLLAEPTEKGGQITLPLAPYSGMLFRIHTSSEKAMFAPYQKAQKRRKSTAASLRMG